MPTLTQLADHFGYVAAALGILVESVGIPFPGETLYVLVAAYAGTGHLTLWLVMICGFVGATAGCDLGYAIGYFGGRPLLERLFGFLHVRPERIAQTEQFFARHGAKAVFGARFVIGARTYGSLLAGVARMPFLPFHLFSTAGSAVWAIALGLVGFLLGNNLPFLEKLLRAIGIAGAVAVVGLAVLIYVLGRRRVGRA